MRHSVYLKSLRDLRRSLAWWSVGLVALAALIVSVFPTVQGNTALNKLVQDYPEALKGFFGFGGDLSYTTAAGYLGMELFSFMVPLLLLVAAIAAGSGAIAGEEDRGTLDLLASLPVSRRRITGEKFAALVSESLALGFVLWISLWIGAHAAGMHIAATKLAAATGAATALAVAYGSIALLLGCATGRRGLATSLTSAAAIVAYLVNSLAPLVGVLQPLQKLSPFYHYAAGDPLRAGVDPIHLFVLLAIALAGASASIVAVERRDLS